MNVEIIQEIAISVVIIKKIARNVEIIQEKLP